MNCDRPPWRSCGVPEVRTSAIMKWQRSALVVQILRPVRRHEPSGCCTARVVTLARSEPAFGSLMPMQKNASPRQIAGR
ncbi:hypothetical protein D3C81_1346000 [compost metagenome]